MYQQTNFPKNVRCLTTPRYLDGGAGTGDYANFNLATYTGERINSVKHNRQLLQMYYQLPSEPKWLNQTHSDCAVSFSTTNTGEIADADASWTRTKGVVCAVLTADCLPIFISDKGGRTIGIIHAGYQGLLNGIIQSLIKASPIKPGDMLVHIGAGISKDALGLTKSIYQQFVAKTPRYGHFFTPSKGDDEYYLDMPALAFDIFNRLGVYEISQENSCTYGEAEKYFSYRRQGAKSGRMASLIWFD